MFFKFYFATFSCEWFFIGSFSYSDVQNLAHDIRDFFGLSIEDLI